MMKGVRMQDNPSQSDFDDEKVKNIIIKIADKVNENEKKTNPKTDRDMIREIEQIIGRSL